MTPPIETEERKRRGGADKVSPRAERVEPKADQSGRRHARTTSPEPGRPAPMEPVHFTSPRRSSQRAKGRRLTHGNVSVLEGSLELVLRLGLDLV